MRVKTKKILSVVLVLVIAFSLVLSLSASAKECEGDKYLSDEILDIANGSNVTLGEINDFDRYQRAVIQSNALYGTDYEVNFESGGADHTHQYIASNAIRVLTNDKGPSLFSNSTYSSLVVEGADWPDKSDMGFIFDTHFYDPYKETNWRGGSTTAKIKADNYYNEAIQAYKSGDITLAMQKIGRGSHFCQDACEAHHATNKTAVNSNHSAYESYIDTVRNKCGIPDNSFDKSVYDEAKYLSVKKIVRNNSYASYCLGDKVTGSSSNPDYQDAAIATVQNGIMSTVQYFYKFAVETGMLQ